MFEGASERFHPDLVSASGIVLKADTLHVKTFLVRYISDRQPLKVSACQAHLHSCGGRWTLYDNVKLQTCKKYIYALECVFLKGVEIRLPVCCLSV